VIRVRGGRLGEARDGEARGAPGSGTRGEFESEDGSKTEDGCRCAASRPWCKGCRG
jgi:hypothetical protein